MNVNISRCAASVALLFFAVGLGGCTTAFTPMEYPLRDGLIPEFNVAGKVKITNAQPSSDEEIVYSYMGTKMASDLKSITEVMVQQAQKELEKNGRPVKGVSSKSIALTVDSLLSEYTNLFHWKSNIQFRATLGDGQSLDFKVPHTSGVLVQDLNGCIAEGVMTLFKDERVKTYLAK